YLLLGSRSRKVRRIDVATGRETFAAVLPFVVRKVAYRSDGEQMFALCENASTIAVKVWDAASGDELTPACRVQRTMSAEGGAFSRDGKTVAVVCTPRGWPEGSGGLLVKHEIDGKTTLSHLRGRGSAVSGVAVSQDGTHLAVATDDGKVTVRDLKKEKLLA